MERVSEWSRRLVEGGSLADFTDVAAFVDRFPVFIGLGTFKLHRPLTNGAQWAFNRGHQVPPFREAENSILVQQVCLYAGAHGRRSPLPTQNSPVPKIQDSLYSDRNATMLVFRWIHLKKLRFRLVRIDPAAGGTNAETRASRRPVPTDVYEAASSEPGRILWRSVYCWWMIIPL
jgi:hypothetical protein